MADAEGQLMVFVAIWVVREKLYITILGGQEFTYLGDCLL